MQLIDLASHEGVQLVKGEWRYHDVKIEDADSRAVGPDLKPSGAPIRTYDYAPHAGPSDFDDSQWEAIDATTLDQRRSTAKVCFNWYRINVTIPEKVGNFSTAGATVAFEIVIDDYAEVWVNGKMPRVLGQPGGPVIKGFNAPNRVIITRDAKPGQHIQLAVFGINGPVSYSPQNFIWIKSATLDFYKSPKVSISETPAQVTRKDAALDEIVPAGAKIEKLAGGFLFTEGPIWVPRTEETDGYLLFSDPNNNLIYRWTQDGQLSIFMTKSGYRGMDIGEYGQPGSNGLTLDKQGRLTINQHGNRRVVRMEKNGQLTVLADHYEGKRLNSPNDLVYKSDGALYFTDPPFGLPKFFDDPRKRAALQRRFPRVSRTEKRPVADQGTERSERTCIFTRREVLLRGQLGREEKDHHAVRSESGRNAGERQGLFRYDVGRRRRRPRRNEDRSEGQPLRVRPRRFVDHLARGQASGHDCWPGTSA